MIIDNTEAVQNSVLLEKAVSLLQSGDDTGCDGLVVVGRQEFLELREHVRGLTGEEHGAIEGEEEPDDAA